MKRFTRLIKVDSIKNAFGRKKKEDKAVLRKEAARLVEEYWNRSSSSDLGLEEDLPPVPDTTQRTASRRSSSKTPGADKNVDNPFDDKYAITSTIEKNDVSDSGARPKIPKLQKSKTDVKETNRPTGPQPNEAASKSEYTVISEVLEQC